MTGRFSVSRLTHLSLAGFGSFVAIYGLTACDSLLRTNGMAGVALIGSFGATAVLVYGAPQAEFSRFRNVVGGHVLSALFGVLAATTLGPDNAVAAGVAVALAVVAMALTHTTHPPGGATALIAVTGGERILHMGYSYVFVPVMVGALCMYTLGFVSRRVARPRVVAPDIARIESAQTHSALSVDALSAEALSVAALSVDALSVDALPVAALSVDALSVDAVAE